MKRTDLFAVCLVFAMCVSPLFGDVTDSNGDLVNGKFTGEVTKILKNERGTEIGCEFTTKAGKKLTIKNGPADWDDWDKHARQLKKAEENGTELTIQVDDGDLVTIS